MTQGSGPIEGRGASTGKRSTGGRPGARKKAADKRREPIDPRKAQADADDPAATGSATPAPASPARAARGLEKGLRVIRERPAPLPHDGEDQVSVTRLVMVRLLEAPVETAWQFLVDPELRALWFMAAADDLRVGGHLGLTMNHDRLSDTTVLLPATWQTWLGHSWQERIRALEPLRLLRFSWEQGQAGEVTFRLVPAGMQTRLVLIHTGLRGADDAINFGGAWRAHLAALGRRVSGLGVADFPLLVAEAELAMRAALASGAAARPTAPPAGPMATPASATPTRTAANGVRDTDGGRIADSAGKVEPVELEKPMGPFGPAEPVGSGIRPGHNLAIKVPLHRWQATVAFYRDRVGLTELQRSDSSVAFAFGQMTLWIDRVEHQSQVDVWLELLADDPTAALTAMDSPCRDELERLEGVDGHWTSDPAGTVLLVRRDPER